MKAAVVPMAVQTDAVVQAVRVPVDPARRQLPLLQVLLLQVLLLQVLLLPARLVLPPPQGQQSLRP